jgi:N-ethylmaleimide reductase
MTKLFEPTKLGDISLANRIVMAPLTRNRSPNAVPNELNVKYYAQRASAGLIITEATAITHQGQGYANVPGLYTKEALDGWKKVTDAVHANGGKIVVQMWHVGRISHTTLQPNGGKPVSSTSKRAETSKTYLVNSDGTGGFADVSEPRALEASEIPGIIEDYRKAARAAIEAGFDGVEIHGANGYLIDQFLRGDINDRTDEYGGSIENRARFLFEVVDAVTKEVGAGRTAIRISPVTPSGDASDPAPQPLFTYVVEGLAKYGLAYIHVVEGQTGGKRDFLPFDYDALHAAYRAAGGKAGWMVNNAYTREMAIEAIDNGKADVVAFGKPFISNPDLVHRLKEDAALAPWDQTTLYGGGAKGYADYPTLDKAA